MCYPGWNGENHGFFKVSFFLQKLLLFIFLPMQPRQGERNPFSAFFVVQSAFRTQKHRQFPPKPCFNLIMMRFADTMNIWNDPCVLVSGKHFQAPVSKAPHCRGKRSSGETPLPEAPADWQPGVGGTAPSSCAQGRWINLAQLPRPVVGAGSLSAFSPCIITPLPIEK